MRGKIVWPEADLVMLCVSRRMEEGGDSGLGVLEVVGCLVWF